MQAKIGASCNRRGLFVNMARIIEEPAGAVAGEIGFETMEREA